MPEVTITVRRNGSLKVEGPFRLIDSNGQEMPIPADKPVISFCRCGHSQNKPFCDGSHRDHNFQGAEPHVLRAEAAEGAGV